MKKQPFKLFSDLRLYNLNNDFVGFFDAHIIVGRELRDLMAALQDLKLSEDVEERHELIGKVMSCLSAIEKAYQSNLAMFRNMVENWIFTRVEEEPSG